MLKIEAFTLGLMIEANCYLVSEDGHALVIDPGSKGRSVQKRIEEMGLIVDAVLLTHGHFDHCAGADAFVETYHCPLYIHPLDAPMLKDPHLNFSADFAPLVVKSKPQMLKQGKQQIGHFEIEMIDAPGHSEGSCLLLMKVGRTDLIGGSNSQMVQTLRMIKGMDPELIFYPGHGPRTILKEELNSNYYLLTV